MCTDSVWLYWFDLVTHLLLPIWMLFCGHHGCSLLIQLGMSCIYTPNCIQITKTLCTKTVHFYFSILHTILQLFQYLECWVVFINLLKLIMLCHVFLGTGDIYIWVGSTMTFPGSSFTRPSAADGRHKLIQHQTISIIKCWTQPNGSTRRISYKVPPLSFTLFSPKTAISAGRGQMFLFIRRCWRRRCFSGRGGLSLWQTTSVREKEFCKKLVNHLCKENALPLHLSS